jgi:hypothetical protein
MHNQDAPPPNTSDSGPTIDSSLRRIPRALLSLSSQRRSRHIQRNRRSQRNRRRSGSLCIPHNLCSLHSHGNRRIPARSARGH